MASVRPCGSHRSAEGLVVARVQPAGASECFILLAETGELLSVLRSEACSVEPGDWVEYNFPDVAADVTSSADDTAVPMSQSNADPCNGRRLRKIMKLSHHAAYARLAAHAYVAAPQLEPAATPGVPAAFLVAVHGTFTELHPGESCVADVELGTRCLQRLPVTFHRSPHAPTKGLNGVLVLGVRAVPPGAKHDPPSSDLLAEGDARVEVVGWWPEPSTTACATVCDDSDVLADVFQSTPRSDPDEGLGSLLLAAFAGFLEDSTLAHRRRHAAAPGPDTAGALDPAALAPTSAPRYTRTPPANRPSFAPVPGVEGGQNVGFHVITKLAGLTSLSIEQVHWQEYQAAVPTAPVCPHPIPCWTETDDGELLQALRHVLYPATESAPDPTSTHPAVAGTRKPGQGLQVCVHWHMRCAFLAIPFQGCFGGRHLSVHGVTADPHATVALGIVPEPQAAALWQDLVAWKGKKLHNLQAVVHKHCPHSPPLPDLPLGTRWALLQSVVACVIRQVAPSSAHFSARLEVQFPLWLAERHCQGITAGCTLPRSLTQAMNLLQSLAQKAATLSRSDLEAGLAVQRLATVRQGLDHAVQRAGVCRSWRHQLPRPSSLQVPNLTVPVPSLVSGLWVGAQGGTTDIVAQETRYLQAFPLEPGAGHSAGGSYDENMAGLQKCLEKGPAATGVQALWIRLLLERCFLSLAHQFEASRMEHLPMWRRAAVLYDALLGRECTAESAEEMYSLRALVVWIAYCGAHAAVSRHYAAVLERDYGTELHATGMTYWCLPTRVSWEAALAVHQYLSAHAENPLFCQDNPEPTYQMASDIGACDAELTGLWNAEQRTAADKDAAYRAEVQRKRALVAQLQQDITTTVAQLQQVEEQLQKVRDIWQNLQSMRRSARHVAINQEVMRDLEAQLQTLPHSYTLQEQVRAYQTQERSQRQQLQEALEPPAPVFHPLPKEERLALCVLFFLKMPECFRTLMRLTFLAHQVLLLPLPLPQECSEEDLDSMAKDSVYTTHWADVYNKYTDYGSSPLQPPSDNFGALALMSSRPPPAYEQVRRGEGIYYPDQLPFGLQWTFQGQVVNPTTAPPTGRCTKRLPESARDLQWAMELREDPGPCRGNKPVAWQSEQPLWLEKQEWHAFCALRAYPNQQLRKLLLALHERALPLGEPAVHCIVRQVLHQLGPVRQGELAWKADMFHGDWVIAITAALDRLAAEHATKVRSHPVMLVLAEVAGFVGQWHRPCLQVCRRVAESVHEWVVQTDVKICGARDPEAQRKLAARKCLFQCYEALAWAAGELDAKAAAALLTARVGIRNALAFGVDAAEPGIRRLLPAVDAAMGARLSEVNELMSKSSALLTEVVREVVADVPRGLRWCSLTSNGHSVPASSSPFGGSAFGCSSSSSGGGAFGVGGLALRSSSSAGAFGGGGAFGFSASSGGSVFGGGGGTGSGFGGSGSAFGGGGAFGLSSSSGSVFGGGGGTGSGFGGSGSAFGGAGAFGLSSSSSGSAFGGGGGTGSGFGGSGSAFGGGGAFGLSSSSSGSVFGRGVQSVPSPFGSTIASAAFATTAGTSPFACGAAPAFGSAAAAPFGQTSAASTVPVGALTLRSDTACYTATCPKGHRYSINLLTGVVLVDGLPSRQLPESIQQHRLFRGTFGNINLELHQLQDGTLRTAKPYSGRLYEFREGLGDTLQITELVPDTEQRLVLIDPDVLEPMLPRLLRRQHSHWLWRERQVMLLRGRNVAERSCSFVVHLWPRVCLRIPPHLQQQPLEELADTPALTEHLTLGHGYPMLPVLAKFEEAEYIHVYAERAVPKGTLETHSRSAPGAPGGAPLGSAPTPSDSGGCLAAPTIRLELPRYNLQFELDEEHGIWLSVDFPGYRLADHQQLSGTLGSFEQYLVLVRWGRSDPSIPETKLIIADGTVKMDGPSGAVTVIRDPESTRLPFLHADVHTFGHLTVATIADRLQLVALYVATASLHPEPLSAMTGTETAMQLLRQCWLNRPLKPVEQAKLDNILRLCRQINGDSGLQYVSLRFCWGLVQGTFMAPSFVSVSFMFQVFRVRR